jgi:hypothetical protein
VFHRSVDDVHGDVVDGAGGVGDLDVGEPAGAGELAGAGERDLKTRLVERQRTVEQDLSAGAGRR